MSDVHHFLSVLFASSLLLPLMTIGHYCHMIFSAYWVRVFVVSIVHKDHAYV